MCAETGKILVALLTDKEIADEHGALDMTLVDRRSKRRWKKEKDYHRRSLVETAIHRFKAHVLNEVKALRERLKSSGSKG